MTLRCGVKPRRHSLKVLLRLLLILQSSQAVTSNLASALTSASLVVTFFGLRRVCWVWLSCPLAVDVCVIVVDFIYFNIWLSCVSFLVCFGIVFFFCGGLLLFGCVWIERLPVLELEIYFMVFCLVMRILHTKHYCSHMTIHISTHQTSARQLTSSYSHTLTHLHTFALTYYKTDFLLQKRSFSNLGHSRVPPTRWSGLPPGLASLCVVSRPGQRGEGRGLETSLPSSDEDLIAG